METSGVFKMILDDFVSRGGILVMFSQQHGYEFSLLPGGDVAGFGWREDQSCFSNGAVLDEWHPIVAHQSNPLLTASIDGFFTKWPANATILYRRTKNQLPAALVYKYGNGYVFATTMYTDYAFSTGQFTSQEKTLIQDLLAWAKMPDKDVVTFSAAAPVTLPVTLTNTSQEIATSVKWQVKDGETVLLEKEDVLTLPAGQTLSYDFSFLSPSDASKLYDVFYQLGTLNPEPGTYTYADNFLVRSAIAQSQPVSGLRFYATTASEVVLLGTSVLVTLHVENDTDTVFSGTIYITIHNDPTAGPIPVGPLLPGQSASFPTSMSARSEPFHVTLYDLQNNVVGSAGLGFRVQSAKVSLSFLLPSGRNARPGSAVTGSLLVQNPQSVSFDTKTTLRFLSPSNELLGTQEKMLTLHAQSTQEVPFSFTAGSSYGIYSVVAETENNGGLIGAASTYITVEQLKLIVQPVRPFTLSAGSNTVNFEVRNYNETDVPQAQLSARLKDGDGKLVSEARVPFTIATLENKVIPATLTIPSLSFGKYMLSYGYSTEGSMGFSVLGALPLENTTEGILDFDRGFYRAEETVSGTLNLINPSRFVQNLAITFSIPQLNFTQNTSATLSPNETKSLHFTASVPATTASGDVAVFAVLNLSNSKTIAKRVKNYHTA